MCHAASAANTHLCDCGLKVAKGIMLTSGGGSVPVKLFFMNTKICPHSDLEFMIPPQRQLNLDPFSNHKSSLLKYYA